MAKREAPPFPRGQTYYNGTTIDSNNLGGANLEGTLWEFEDIDLNEATPGVRSARTNRPVTCMIVRNAAAAALLPKRLVTMKATTGATFVAQVDGYADTTAESPAWPVDEWLPAAGVPVGDLFYIVVDGPAMVLTALEADANNVFSVGTRVVALTGATSGATTSGRVRPQDLTGATALLGEQIQGRIGRALTAKTTANTGVDLLIDVTRW
jgi:hypothetical protein